MSGIQRAIRSTKPFLGGKIISQGKIKGFIWFDINPFILQTTLQSKKILHSLSDLAVIVKELDNLNEALEHILQRRSWGLDPNLALLVEVGQVLDGAGLGRLQGVDLLKAVAALVQGGLVQVALPVDGLDGAGGADDKVFVALKLDQLVLSRQGEGKRKEKEEEGLHCWAQSLRMVAHLPASVTFKGDKGEAHRVHMDSNNDNKYNFIGTSMY